MEDRTVFDQFHEALDVEPRPGSYERMRLSLTTNPVVLHRQPGFRMRFSRVGFRVAAAVVAAVIVVVALAAYLSLHHSSVGVVPAQHGPDLRPYQAVIARDYAKTYASEGTGHCNSFADTGCATGIGRVNVNLQAWLQDLKGLSVPSRFTQVDAMLRAHLAEAIEAGNIAIVAQKAGNVALFDSALNAHLEVRAFIVAIAPAVADTQVVDAAKYSSSVQDQMSALVACTPCGKYLATPPITCAKAQLASCVDDVVAVDAQVYNFELAIVQLAAPATLTAQDANLQKDLGAADAALVAMKRAGLAGDTAGFATSAAAAQHAMAAVAADVATIPKA